MITKKELVDITTALNSGLVPRSGIEHIMVGREKLLDQLDRDLKLIAEGNSVTKFIIGKYGTGKSFVQTAITQNAHGKNMVGAKVDFSPFVRLYHRDGMAKALYTAIVKNLTTSTSSNNTIELIVENWIQKVLEAVAFEQNIPFDFNNQIMLQDARRKIEEEISKIDNDVGTSDFTSVLIKYFDAYTGFDEEIQKSAIKWLSGEYSTKTDAKRELGVSNIIDDLNYYEFIKVLCNFVVLAGFSGLVINFDEVVNIYKISQKDAREKNYEMILKIFNDTIQGRIQHLFITFCGTLQFLEDEYKGVYSYAALKRRLISNKYEDDRFSDYSQPVLKLKPLDDTEKLILLKKIMKIYEAQYNFDYKISDEDIINYLEKSYAGIQRESITIGSLVRDFVGALNIIHDNPSLDSTEIFRKAQPKKQFTEEDILNRFEIN